MDRNKDPGIVFGQILLEEAEFSHRTDYLRLVPTTRAEVGDVDVNISGGEFEGLNAGMVRVEVATRPENKPTYNFRVAMVAIVQQHAQANMSVRDYVSSPNAVAALYPFVREAIANLTIRGRFGPIWLNPINFVSRMTVEKGQKGPAKRVKLSRARAK